ncbi:glycosyltransferase [Alphaproteobacteria bacterium]|jgi:mannosyltransferase OCH1-like enzyme|nr:glycosyltransferase [Alphaproteobacteria bacterium]
MSNKILNIFKKKIRTFTEYPLVKIEDRLVPKNSKNKIPNKVYQTWETRFLGKSHARSIKKFRNLNPDLSFYLYDKDKRDKYMKSNWQGKLISDIYFNSQFGPMRSDIFRYCILYEFGGYYFDIGKACSIPLNNLHTNDDTGIITYEDNEFYYPPCDQLLFKLKRPFNYFLQWGLGFSPKHQFLKQLIDEIESNYHLYKAKVFANPKLAILNFTGPGAYTKIMRKYLVTAGISNFSELDIKFNNTGIFKINGASVRHYIVPSYTYSKNAKICN